MTVGRGRRCARCGCTAYDAEIEAVFSMGEWQTSCDLCLLVEKATGGEQRPLTVAEMRVVRIQFLSASPPSALAPNRRASRVNVSRSRASMLSRAAAISSRRSPSGKEKERRRARRR
jgi:hypothetical protein